MAINIVTRAPSNQHTYDAFWSKDPALVQGNGEEHQRRLAVARETGDWSPLVIAGQSPTKFVLRPIGGEAKRRILDRFSAKTIGHYELDALLLRLAIRDVVGLGEFKLGFVASEEWGPMASHDLCDVLDEHAPGCVGELALQIFNRMIGVSGK